MRLILQCVGILCYEFIFFTIIVSHAQQPCVCGVHLRLVSFWNGYLNYNLRRKNE